MARRENIHVTLRFRPLCQRELEDGEKSVWLNSCDTVQLRPEVAQLLIETKRLTSIPKCYTYSNFHVDYCFGAKDSNRKVYDTVARRVVMASLEGYNGTVFAYGQTGSGKTYTMMGSEGAELDRSMYDYKASTPRTPDRRSASPLRSARQMTPDLHLAATGPKEKGLVSYALEDLFQTISSTEGKNYCLTCSYFEIYNEQVFDLLTDNIKARGTPLVICEDTVRGFYVKGLSEHVTNSMEEVLRYLERGEANRHYAGTAMNHHSSRSHTIFRLNVTSVTTVLTRDLRPPEMQDCDSDDSTNNITTESVLNFVDLAGSERATSLQETFEPVSPLRRSATSSSNRPRRASSKSPNSLETLANEGKHINTSLFYLCQVISKLSDKTNPRSEAHVPYRNSNLTKILRASLGGNSLTCIVCTATPTLPQFEMTLSTLRFGGIARTITNQVEANIRSDKNAELLAAYQNDIEKLKHELEVSVQGGRHRAEEAAMVRRQLEERITKLTQMLFNKITITDRPRDRGEGPELWSSTAGDLHMSRPLLVPEKLSRYVAPQTQQLRYDDKAVLALGRLRNLGQERVRLETEAKELRETNKCLQDSKLNLKSDLKKSIALCRKISEKKVEYKRQLRAAEDAARQMKSRLELLEHGSGLDGLGVDQLEQLETFFYRGLDSVKVAATQNARFRKLYQRGVEDLENNPRRSNEDPSLWGALGLCEGRTAGPKSPDSSDSSLEFESSFFQYKRGDDFSMQVSRIEKVEDCNLSTFMVSELKDSKQSDVSLRSCKVDMV